MKKSEKIAKALATPPWPGDAKKFPKGGQTSPTAGRDKVRETAGRVTAPRQSKRGDK